MTVSRAESPDQAGSWLNHLQKRLLVIAVVKSKSIKEKYTAGCHRNESEKKGKSLIPETTSVIDVASSTHSVNMFEVG